MDSLSSPTEHCCRLAQRYLETTVVDILQYPRTLVRSPPPLGAQPFRSGSVPTPEALALMSGRSCLACPLWWSVKNDVFKGDGNGASPASHLLFSKLPMHSLCGSPEDPHLFGHLGPYLWLEYAVIYLLVGGHIIRVLG